MSNRPRRRPAEALAGRDRGKGDLNAGGRAGLTWRAWAGLGQRGQVESGLGRDAWPARVYPRPVTGQGFHSERSLSEAWAGLAQGTAPAGTAPDCGRP